MASPLSVSTGDVFVDRVPWAPGSASGQVVAAYAAALRLWPEDCFGIVPGQLGAGELLLAYRDSPEYAERRGRPLLPASRALEAAVFVHHLPWPDASHSENSAGPADSFSSYSRTVGLRPEDCFGWVPDGWNPHGSAGPRWDHCRLVYRDRPEYADGRARLRALQGRHEAERFDRFPSPSGALPPLAGPGMRASATETSWPRRHPMRIRDQDVRGLLAELIVAAATPPERTFGIGVDRGSQHIVRVWG